MPTYTVEIDGKRYKIAGDRPPSEAEARAAVGAYTQQPANTQPTPSPERGPVERFLEPVGQAIKGVVGLPGAAARAMSESPMGIKAGWELARTIADDSAEQAVAAADAFGEGDYGMAAGRALAAIPVVGKAGADMGEAIAEGNYAGALGQAAVNFAPGARVPRMLRPTAISGLLKRRAAARILDVMRPATGRAAKAEGIAEDLVMGVPGRETAGGIGVGTLDELSERAAARASSAGRDIKAFQTLDTPIDPSPVSRSLRAEADELVTRPPAREVLNEVDTGMVDEFGDPIMGIKREMVKGVPASEYPALVSALRRQARRVDKLAKQYPDEAVPAGELFKQRAAAGRRHGKAYRNMPGDEPAAVGVAGKAYKGRLTDLLHEEVPGSVIPDREYAVFRNAATNFERRRLSSLNQRGWRGLRDLLMGRAVGSAMGAGTGMLTFGPLGGVAGALGGAILGESAFWGSLRAATYAKLARALNNGQLDQAAEILQRSAAAYAADQGIRERERHRDAERALRTQAEGVVAP